MAAVSSPTTSAGRPVPSIPPALLNAEVYAGIVYRAIDTERWMRGTYELRYLQQAVMELRQKTPGDSADLDLLATTFDRLHKAVEAQARLDALHAANEMTLIMTHLAEPYAPLVPPDVDRLGYYGRSVQILTESGDRTKAAQVVKELAQTWTGVRPFVAEHAGAALAARFDETVRALDTERDSGRVEELASAELDDLDVIRRAITDGHRSAR